MTYCDLSHTLGTMQQIIAPATIAGTVRIPSSKSQTIRALLIATAAEGKSTLEHPLRSRDTEACLGFCRALGAHIAEEDQRWIVTGIGSRPALPDKPLLIDTGNSGTTLYLGAGIAASLGIPVVLTGDEQIRRRPVANLTEALAALGTAVSYDIPEDIPAGAREAEGCPPVAITGPLQGGEVTIACPTSQYLSALLLAAVGSQRECIINVSLLNEAPYAEMTIEWLEKQQIDFRREGMERFIFPGKQRFRPFSCSIPGDYSSASFFLCAAAVTGSTLSVAGLDPDDSQGDRQILTWLEQMGCAVTWSGDTVILSGPDTLNGINIDLNTAPDALPVLAVTGCYATGTTRLLNVPQARIKETDRISVMNRELSRLGAGIEELPDGMVIRGRGRAGLQGGTVSGHGDHRVVMALAVAALAAESPVTIDGSEAAAVTFPDFFSLLESVRE